MFSKKAIKASAFELLTLTRVNLGLSKDFLSAVNLLTHVVRQDHHVRIGNLQWTAMAGEGGCGNNSMSTNNKRPWDLIPRAF